MNESAILAQGRNEEERQFIKKWINNVKKVDERNQCVTTPFIDPGQQQLLRIICQSAQVDFTESGGFNGAERKRFFIYPPSWGELDEQTVCLVKITANKFSKTLSHRDYLGSLLGLGLERTVIGDIIVVENGCYVAVSNEIKAFIFQELTTVGRETVELSETTGEEKENIIKQEPIQYQRATVSSTRLDAVIATSCKLSRTQSQLLIKQGKVKINHREVASSSHVVEDDTLLSVRGIGRIHIKEIQGITKKGRTGIVFGLIGK